MKTEQMKIIRKTSFNKTNESLVYNTATLTFVTKVVYLCSLGQNKIRKQLNEIFTDL